MKSIFNKYLAPLFLILVTPPFAMIITYTNIHLNGSFQELGQFIIDNGFMELLNVSWFSRFFGSLMAWKIIGSFAVFQLFLMKVLPGKKYKGTLTPKGNYPEYKDNGLLAYSISIGFFFIGSLVFNWFSPAIIYNHFLDILAALNISALLFCLFLYFKGKYAPTSTDCDTSGNFIFDYYWGTELHPNILGWDVKMFTNCRFGMIGWALAVVSYAFAQKDIYGSFDYAIVISAALIVMYLFKFFIWEEGYMRSMDIQVDRAGFYICWGCLVWVPAIYTSPVLFMVHHPVALSFFMAILIFALGTVAIWINYWADRQRQMVRAKDGDVKIWGKDPVLIKAKYTTNTGEEKESLLLASGFWGISRHFHYLPEIAAAFLWSCATGFSYLSPFFYVIFLSILLVHRAFRDEDKCANKYGKYWDEYKLKVPYKIIPKIL